MISLPKTFPHKYEHVLVCVDNYTKFCVAAPLRSKSSAEILEAFKRCWAGPIGLPAYIKSDNELGIANGVFKEWMDTYGVKHTTCLPYSPAGNGQAEITVKLLKQCLRAFAMQNDATATWDEYLWVITNSCNNLVSGSTLQTPDFLMHTNYCMNQMNNPIHLLQNPARFCKAIPEHEKRKEVLKIMQDVAKQHKLQVARNCSQKNAGKDPPPIEEGHLVLLKVMRKSPAAGVPNSLQPKWLGPFKVLKMYEKMASLKHCITGVERVASASHLKHYFTNVWEYQFPDNWDKPIEKWLKQISPKIDKLWLKNNPSLPETLDECEDLIDPG